MNPTAVKALFVVVGVCALLVGLGWFAYGGVLRIRGRSAAGVVVGHEQEDLSTQGGGAMMAHPRYAPIVAFKTTAARTVQFTSSEFVDRAQYPLGLTVPVLYDPSHPERAEIDSMETLWLAGMAWSLGGLACIAAGFGAARVMERMRADVPTE